MSSGLQSLESIDGRRMRDLSKAEATGEAILTIGVQLDLWLGEFVPSQENQGLNTPDDNGVRRDDMCLAGKSKQGKLLE